MLATPPPEAGQAFGAPPPATETGSEAAAPDGAGNDERTREGTRRNLPLLWRLFIANGLVLACVALLLALAPITISVPIAFGELVIVVAGLVLMLAIDLLLLRKVLFPLRRLTEVMRSVTPDSPGLRLDELPHGDAEVSALTRAFNDMLDRLEAERQASGRAALAAQERERGRIARELHDEIGQSLTAVLIHTERVAADDSVDARTELDRVAADVRLSLEDVRRIARRLRPEALDDLGLVNALIALCSRMSDHSGLQIERDLPSGLPTLASDTELVIYRIAQEGLNNAVRHAEASRAALSLRVKDDSLVLTVADDGRGLPAEISPRSSGISGMRERTLLVNGQLAIRQRPVGGTEIRLSLPLDGAT